MPESKPATRRRDRGRLRHRTATASRAQAGRLAMSCLLSRTSFRLTSWTRAASQHLGNCLIPMPHEARRQVLRQQRVRLRPGNRVLDVFLMLALRAFERNQRCRQLHLWILSAQPNSLFHPLVTVHARRRIRLTFAQPLLEGFRQVPKVEESQGVWVPGGGARVKL